MVVLQKKIVLFSWQNIQIDILIYSINYYYGK